METPHVKDLTVRVNSMNSGLAEDDIKTILQADRLPDTMILPKVDSVGHIQWVSLAPFVLTFSVLSSDCLS